ncbi:MAG: M1 family metallopeptidase [Woeseiaceae bacterium]
MTNPRARMIPALLFTLALLVAACAERQAPTAERSPGPPIGILGNPVTPAHYWLELVIDPSQERFSGTATINVSLNEDRADLWLHGKNLNVTDVFAVDRNNERVDATYAEKDDSGVALVTFERAITKGPAVLHFTYDAPFNTAENGLFRVERDGDYYAATQFQPIAARQVFPGFDEPAFKVPFDLTFIARAADVVVTTTPEVSSTDMGNGLVKHVFATTRPLPTYLIAIAVGPYDLVDYDPIAANDVRRHELPLRAIAARGLGDKLGYALANTEGILTVLEQYFGTPYPYKKLDLIAMPESFGGAMENAGAITYDEYLLVMDEDAPLRQRRAYTGTHAHELAHMWFGDLVTPKWWNDIWLNESFASWMQNKAAHAYWPDGEFDRSTLKGALSAMAGDSLAAARQIREPVERNADIGTAFDGITYQKGGGVLAMLERYVGEERFRAGVRLHIQRHEDGVATTEDFIKSLAEGSERKEIGTAFTSFIEQPGVPLVSLSVNCETGQQPRLDLSQSRYAPLGSTIDANANTWQVPVCLSYVADGKRDSTCLLLSERQQSVMLDMDDCPTSVHPNADGAGYYRFALDDNAWRGLLSVANDLPATEALALADSLDAAFRSGAVGADEFVAGTLRLVNHGTWDVAEAAIDSLESIQEIIPVSERPLAHQAFINIARPRLARLADANDPGSEILRQNLRRFLIVVARDPETRAPLARLAAARIGFNVAKDVKAVSADRLDSVLTVGVQELGEGFFDLLFEQAVSSSDQAFRSAAIRALARTDDPELADKLRQAILADRFKGTESLSIIFQLMGRPESSEQTFAWMKANSAVIIDTIPESFRSGIVPVLGSSFCSNEKAAEWQAFVVANGDKIPGYERRLAQTMERIELCTALREARAADLLGALTS